MTITSEEARAREVLAATPHLTGCLRYRGVPGGCTCDNDRAVRAMLAFAHQSPSRAAGEGFLDAVREFGPNGEFVVVQVWPNGDWSVFDPASENAPKVALATPAELPAPKQPSGYRHTRIGEGGVRITSFSRDGEADPDYPDETIEPLYAHTPAELPALPSREEIARVIDLIAFKDRARYKKGSDAWINACEDYDAALDKADAILSLFATPQTVPAREAPPTDMLLYCPKCGIQHVDEPDERTPDWSNPPHRSHLCHGCGCIWRPADVPTNGVASIATVGKADTWTAAPEAATPSAVGGVDRMREALEASKQECARLRRQSTDRAYMIEALVKMLGPKARKIWDIWQAKGVLRVHFSHGPEGEKLTGEEAAQMYLDIEEAIKTASPIENVDEHVAALAIGETSPDKGSG